MIDKNILNHGMFKRFKKHGTKIIDTSITLLSLYEKEKGVCAKCGNKTVYGVHPVIPNSATIEHKIPLSCGGSHTWKNVRLFCYKCNSDENTKKQAEQNKIPEKIFSLFGHTFYYKKV